MTEAVRKIAAVALCGFTCINTSISCLAATSIVSISQNSGGTVEINTDAYEVSPGRYSCEDNQNVQIFVTANEGFTLNEVYFNGSPLNCSGEGRKQMEISPNSKDVLLEIEFASKDGTIPDDNAGTVDININDLQNKDSSMNTVKPSIIIDENNVRDSVDSQESEIPEDADAESSTDETVEEIGSFESGSSEPSSSEKQNNQGDRFSDIGNENLMNDGAGTVIGKENTKKVIDMKKITKIIAGGASVILAIGIIKKIISKANQ